MRQPKVSIIVPNYNYEQYLRQRLNCIIGQSLEDFELILIDDCSTDNSRDILTSYAESDERVSHFLVNERNSGSPFAQWKKGIELAKGKYVWIAEADDNADCHFLERLVEKLEAYPQASVAMSASVLIDEQENFLPQDYDRLNKREYVERRQATIYPGEEFVVRNMYWRNWIYNASGAVFRRDAVNDRALTALSMQYCADWLFWSELIAPAHLIEVHNRYNYFRLHPKSVTHRSDYLGSIEAVEIISGFNSRFNIPACKRAERAGRFYRRTDKLKLSPQQRLDVYEHIQKAFGIGKLPALTLDFLSKICPFLPRESRDNIQGTASTPSPLTKPISRHTLAATVVWYNPTEEHIRALQTYSEWVEKVFVIDNSNSDNRHLLRNVKGQIFYHSNKQNRGVGDALNLGFAFARIEKKFQWLLTMDQDSRFEPGDLVRFVDLCNSYEDLHKVGIFSPHQVYGDEPHPDLPTYEKRVDVMTSGNIVRIEAFEQVIGFRPDYFIDLVDEEFCLRVGRKGYDIIMVNDIHLQHHLGNGYVETRLLRHKFIDHPPIRYYYITRNTLMTAALFSERRRHYKKQLRKRIKRLLLYVRQQKGQKMLMTWQGLVDYWRVRMGRYEDLHGEK